MSPLGLYWSHCFTEINIIRFNINLLITTNLYCVSVHCKDKTAKEMLRKSIGSL